MELDKGKVKRILEESFDKIIKMQNERGLTFDEIKNFLAEVLYAITIYGEKVDSPKTISVDEETNTPEVKAITVEMPQVLYGPPPVDSPKTISIDEGTSGLRR